MLILTRKVNQSVFIKKDGEVIAAIMVTQVLGDKVKLGIESPEEYIIVREEIDD